MKSFSRFSILATAATYFLIFVGGLVRVSGAGLGCPDWPKCFDRWIPPIHVSQLPVGFDAADFNFTLAWIEYINRLVGMTVGTLIAIVGFWAIFKFRKHPGILIPSILASLLVAYQGWQGSQVVASGLEPYIISIHMGLAFIIASLLVFSSTRSYLIANSISVPTDNKTSGMKAFTIIIAAVAFIQVILGTRVREALESAVENLPLASHAEIAAQVGGSGHFHSLVGLMLTFGVVIYSIKLLQSEPGKLSSIRQAALILIGLSFVQVAVGAVIYIFEINEVMQVMHMWISSIMLGALLIIYAVLSYKRPKNG